MPKDEFAAGPFDEEPQVDEKRTARLLMVILAAGMLGIGVSASAVYFLSGGNTTALNAKLRAAVGSAIEVRKAPQESSGNRFSSPRLSQRRDLPQSSDSEAVATLPSLADAAASPASSGRFGNILISEVQIAGTGAGDEFVELYNPNDFAVSLDGWNVKRKTASGKEYTLISATALKGATIAAKSYFLAARSGADIPVAPDAWWAKSNTIAEHTTIILYGKRENESVIVDAVGFGDAYEFEGAPAPNPAEGETLSRKADIDTDNNAADFVRSLATPRNAASGSGFVPPQFVSSPTPSSATILQSIVESSPEPSPTPSPEPRPLPSPSSLPSPSPSPSPEPAPSSLPNPAPSPSSTPTGMIRISEILFNPAGSDEGKEFIELVNSSGSNLDINGWALRLQDPNATSSTSLVAFGSKREDVTVIPAGGYLLMGFNGYNSSPVADVMRSAVLPNSSRTIFLLNSEGGVVDTVTYDGSIPEGSSWERISSDGEVFQVQSVPSPTNASGS